MKLEPFSNVLDQQVLELTHGEGLPNALSLGIETLICMNLIEQVQLGANDSPSMGVLSKDSIVRESIELGIPDEVDIERGLEVLVERGYLKLISEEAFELLPPFNEASEILRRIFPSMHGINLLAYLVQTLEEVRSGRKGLSQAVSQFRDTLKIHSATSPREPDSEEPLKKKPSPDLLKELKERARRKAQQAKDSSPNLLSQNEEVSAKEVNLFDLFGAEEESEKGPSGPQEQDLPNKAMGFGSTQGSEQSAPQSSSEDEVTIKEEEKSTPSEQEIENEKHEESLTSSLNLEIDPGTLTPEDKQPTQKPNNSLLDDFYTEKSNTQTDPKPDTLESPFDEKAIEEKVKQFAQELARLCPLCGKGRVQERLTASGKKYYQCDQKVCQFISWGKPLPLPCPICNNPFLVEVESSSAPTKVKCPRATCGYEGEPPNQSLSKKPSPAQPGFQPGPKVLAKVRKRRVRRRVLRKR